jgi:hypothetical protein
MVHKSCSSNIPQTALVATLDTYELYIIHGDIYFGFFSAALCVSIIRNWFQIRKPDVSPAIEAERVVHLPERCQRSRKS